MSRLPYPLKRIGIWMSEKKAKKISITDIEEIFRTRNMEAVKIDLSTSLDSQGPFHGILHKLTDVIALADCGNKDAEVLLSRFEEYVSENPEVLIIDPTKRIRTLLDRFKTYSVIQTLRFLTKETVFVPSFVLLESNKQNENIHLLRSSRVTFPLVCKPIAAHGSRDAHQLILVFNENGLSDCSFPCVVQSFVNHNAVLYKLFVIGDENFVVNRPSIKNLFYSEDTAPIHFHSGDISKPASSNMLTLQPEDEMQIGENIEPSSETFRIIAKSIRKLLGLSLFGVDLVIDSTTGRLAIVDINAFPGYDGVDDYIDRLADFVRGELDKRTDVQNHADSFIARAVESTKKLENGALNGFIAPSRLKTTFLG